MNDRDELASDIHAIHCYDEFEFCRRDRVRCMRIADHLLDIGYRKVDPAADTNTEYGVRRLERFGSSIAGPMTFTIAQSLAEAWGEGNVVVSRTVTTGPWHEVEQ